MDIVLPLPLPAFDAMPTRLKAVGLAAIIASVKLIDAAEKRFLVLCREMEHEDGRLRSDGWLRSAC